jgi:hypothetical protein
VRHFRITLTVWTPTGLTTRTRLIAAYNEERATGFAVYMEMARMFGSAHEDFDPDLYVSVTKILEHEDHEYIEVTDQADQKLITSSVVSAS